MRIRPLQLNKFVLIFTSSPLNLSTHFRYQLHVMKKLPFSVMPALQFSWFIYSIRHIKKEKKDYFLPNLQIFMQVSGMNFFPLSTTVTTTVRTQRSFQLTFSTSYKHGLASGASSVMDTSSSWNFELKNGFSASVNRQSAADHNVAARLKMHV